MKRADRYPERPCARAKPRTVLALAASLVLVAGCNAAIGGGVLAVGVVAAILTYDCAEGVGVTVRDRVTAHPVCDATVVAERGEKRVTFSPCYSSFLDEGSWTVTATKAGYQPAVGTLVISHQRRCSEPTYHSLELTLLRGDETPQASRLTPSPGPPVIPTPAPSPEPRPEPTAVPPAAPAPPLPPAAPALSAPEPAAPGAAPPSAAFPPLAPKTR